MNTENELFGELHEQEENGLFGNEHRRQYEAQQEELRQSAVSCWVSVSESLPQTDGTYLTFTKNKVSESIGFTLFVDGQFMSSFVTHWAVVEKPCS